jgi:hypothetical protein
MRVFLYVIFCLVLFLLPLLAGPNIGDPCPDFQEYDTTYTYHTLSQYEGNVVFLNLGESW